MSALFECVHGKSTPGNRAVRRVRTTAVVLLAALAFAGCRTATEPITGRPQFIITSPGNEARMGLSAWQEILKEENVNRDPAYNNALQRVGTALSQAVDRPEYEWAFRVLEDDQANAFCLPGGKIAVYTGLFDYVRNDAELAAVVGHEIAHATARHGGERMSHAMLQNLGALGLSAALGSAAEEERARWMAAYAGLTTVGVVLPYSRTHEYSADEIGLMYMAEAGYDPGAALDFWKRFAEGKPSGAIAEFLSTHPVGENRIARLRQQMPRARMLYENAPVKRGYGRTLPGR